MKNKMFYILMILIIAVAIYDYKSRTKPVTRFIRSIIVSIKSGYQNAEYQQSIKVKSDKPHKSIRHKSALTRGADLAESM